MAAPADYRESVGEWRRQIEADLKSEAGYLTLVGLTWLDEGMNEIDVPEGVPSFGRFELREDKVFLHPADGGPRVEMKPGEKADEYVIRRGTASVQLILRGQRKAIRLRDLNSVYRSKFTGRSWYPIREAYRIEAKWTPYEPPNPVRIVSVQGDETPAFSPGYAEFDVNGIRCRLEPTGQDKLFFIFKDGTSGKGTYPAGRFLYADLPKDGKVVLDFNKAYNPPCAFTPYTTCPLPPRHNWLTVRVEAGELNYAYAAPD